MKNNSKFLILLAAWGLLAAGCAKEGKTTDPVEGEKTFVRLTVRTDVKATRASTEESNAEGAEIAVDITKGLKVAIFRTDGSYEKALSLTLTGEGSSYTSEAIEVTTGDKYFFVFANDGNGLIELPTAGTMTEFMQTVITTTTPGEATSELGTVVGEANTHFLLGTLWAVETPVPAGGTAASPATVSLSIGRLAAKVNLIDITYGKADNILGTFSAPVDGEIYRLGSMPYNIHYVGNHTGEYLPIGSSDNNKNVLVTSAAHNLVAGESYLAYSATWAPLEQARFTTENTSNQNLDIQQTYGNTTFIQIRSVYRPAAAELYDLLSMLPHGTAPVAGTTFWRATVSTTATDGAERYRGQTLLFSTNPTGNANIDNATVQEYTGGITYHKFPIADPNETNAVMKNRVLRNHYYEFTVTRFNSIGSNSPNVDQTEPLNTNSMVLFTVTVRNWDKVSNTGVEVD